jgi:hypothetical protein
VNNPTVKTLKTAPTRLPAAPSRSPAWSWRYWRTCWVAVSDRAVLEADTTVVSKWAWVKALSWSIQTGSC